MDHLAAVLAPLPQIHAWQTELYKHLHAHPELSLHEVATAAIMAAKLRELGYEVTENIGGTGVIGVLRNGAGPTVTFRADMDGLPVKEATGLDYASTDTAIDDEGNSVGTMHACGHDFHMVWLLGAAELLARGTEHWSGTFVALFQPAEERGLGARAMVADGLTARFPRPDVVLGQHVGPERAGLVLTKPGPMLAQSDSIDVTVYGLGAHGSMPHAGIDPAVLVAAIVMRVQTVVAREISPFDFGVVTVGRMEVGTKANIISDRGRLQFNVRSYDPAVRDTLLGAIERIVRAECAAAGSPKEPEFHYFDQSPLTTNDTDTFVRVRNAFDAAFGDESVEAVPFTGSEDFSHLATAYGAPYMFWFVGGTDPEVYDAAVATNSVARDVPSNHSPFFGPILEPTLTRGTEAAVVSLLAYLAKD